VENEVLQKSDQENNESIKKEQAEDKKLLTVSKLPAVKQVKKVVESTEGEKSPVSVID
jgi:hypothetical protein